MYFDCFGIHDKLGEREHILVTGSIVLWSSSPWVMVETVQFMMGMTVCYPKLAVSPHSANWIRKVLFY